MKTVILCDGKVPDASDLRNSVAESSLFIAADGGANIARELNLTPDIIIGDLDSYKQTGNESAEVIHDSDQETNDLEKALKLAKSKGSSEVVVYGATGKRLDHTLKNLSVMKQFNSHFNSLVFKDQYSDIFLISSPYRNTFPTGTSLSLFPLSGKVESITSKGLKYPLKNLTLENGVQDGTSNETVENQVEIEFKKGDLLLLINNKIQAS